MLTINYDRLVDALAIHLRTRARSARTVRVPNIPNCIINIDLDAANRPIAIEILHASALLDRKTLASLPSGAESLTLAEAAKESGLQAATLRVLLNKGRLAGEKRGRDWFVDATALMNYLESREPRGRPARNPKARRAS